MGTHPIFESDFDCLTLLDSNRNRVKCRTGLQEKILIHRKAMTHTPMTSQKIPMTSRGRMSHLPKVTHLLMTSLPRMTSLRPIPTFLKMSHNSLRMNHQNQS